MRNAARARYLALIAACLLIGACASKSTPTTADSTGQTDTSVGDLISDSLGTPDLSGSDSTSPSDTSDAAIPNDTSSEDTASPGDSSLEDSSTKDAAGPDDTTVSDTAPSDTAPPEDLSSTDETTPSDVTPKDASSNDTNTPDLATSDVENDVSAPCGITGSWLSTCYSDDYGNGLRYYTDFFVFQGETTGSSFSWTLRDHGVADSSCSSTPTPTTYNGTIKIGSTADQGGKLATQIDLLTPEINYYTIYWISDGCNEIYVGDNTQKDGLSPANRPTLLDITSGYVLIRQ
ncbi:MAG: hypothetical protein KC609_09725 [Myxococcales bacterium]|nr:hypothetical protein [Myxococcales bacterium]